MRPDKVTMAIYHFSAQIISRISDKGTPRSAVAAAAYRSGEKLYSEQDGESKFYKRDVMPETYLLCPDNAPEWARNRESLWNEVEKIEKRYDAQLAREINIALPRELSEEEQTKLALEFCQKNFVDAGMVADIGIHRDKAHNPHFHVMLTLREIDDNGKFMSKSRKVYELDKDGNKIKLPSGNYKSHKENRTNWDDKETLQKWRENWQRLTNQYLEKNGLSERIDCRSYAEQNSILIPTIHEGPKVHHAVLSNQETEIGDYNKQVREYNSKIIKLEEYKRERENLREQHIYRCFTKVEKEQLVYAAKQLHFYVNNENIEQRLKQLDKWEKSHFYQGGEFNKFERILKERQIIKDVKEIFKNEAARFCDKYYEGVNLLPEDKTELVSRTIDRGQLLSSSEIDALKLELREKEFREVTRHLLTNGNVFWMDAVREIQKEELKARESSGISVAFNDVLKLDSAKGAYHIYQDKHTNQTFIGKQESRENVTRVTEHMSVKEAHSCLLEYIKGTAEIPYIRTYNIDKVEKLEQALCVMDKLYDEQIYDRYGDSININNMTIPEKEMILHYEEYYGTLYQQNYIPAPPYSVEEKKNIIKLMTSGEVREIGNIYPQFKNNSVYLNMFVMDCLSDEGITDSLKNELKQFVLPETKNADKEYMRMPISPHTLISQILSGIARDMKRQEQSSPIIHRIRKRRKRLNDQNLQQNQGII